MSKLKTAAFLLLLFITVYGTNAQQVTTATVHVRGQMPSIARDKSGVIHIAYGVRDSLFYISSRDGKSFSAPALIAVIPGVFTTAMRGPQIAVSSKGVLVTACTKKGDIFAMRHLSNGWSVPRRLNARPETAKEGLMALAADGPNVFAVWLNVKDPKGQALHGIYSRDGGQTWGSNTTVYDSPDKSICECCKPSVAIKGSEVFIMYRNWLGGNRDMYLLHAASLGRRFGAAKKQGTGSWPLNACPMDGGGLAIDDFRKPATIWQRAGKIYTTTERTPELLLGDGRNGAIETVRNTTLYAWNDQGNILLKKNAEPVSVLGKGSQPLLKKISDKNVLCLWQTGDQIEMKVIEL